jgi:hypothetical protein
VASPHDALDDALVTAQAFLILATRLPAGPDPTVSQLLRAARSGGSRVEQRFNVGV